jgi:hypothetical protein
MTIVSLPGKDSRFALLFAGESNKLGASAL